MRALGAVLVALGGAGAFAAVRAATTRGRPGDLLAALLAPLAIVVLLTGGVLLFAPGFLQSAAR